MDQQWAGNETRLDSGFATTRGGKCTVRRKGSLPVSADHVFRALRIEF